MDGAPSPPIAKVDASAIFSPLLGSMIGILLVSLGVVFYHFILLKYCRTRSLLRNAQSSAAQPPASVYSPNGVDKILLETIPIFSVAELKIDERECVVCLGDLEGEDKVRLLPNCKHAFHLECIDQWFAAHDSCPLCRSPILAPAETDDCKPVDVIDLSSSPENEISIQPDSSNVPGTAVDESTSTSTAAAEVQLEMLRHSVSMVSRPRLAEIEFKRSLSVDQTIDLERGRSNRENGSLDSSSGANQNTRSHLERLIRSFSRLRSGRKEDNTISGSGTTLT